MMHLTLRNRPPCQTPGARGAPLAVSGRSQRARDMRVPAPAQLRRFVDLRRAAMACGFAIQSPAMPNVGTDELRLLAWLAEAQRVAGPSTMPDAPELAAAILACAGLLDGMGLRLSPLTLYGARLRALIG